MSIRSFAVNPRARRALAAAAVVLSVGALVLTRTSVSADPGKPLGPGAHGVTFSGPGVQGSLSLSQGKVWSERNQTLFAELRFASTAERAAIGRTPLSLALVLDTSGSMQGNKLEQARNSVLRLIDSMNDSDEIALIRYSTSAELVQPLTRLGTVRSSLRARVMEMGAGGGTNIPGGLGAGIDALRFAGRDRIHRLVLVSDGLDSSRPQSESLAQSSASRGVTISALGIGLDFDEAYLSAVARMGRGNFGFVRDGSALARFLDRELRETAATTVRNAMARLRLPAGVHFVRAIGAEATVRDRDLDLQMGSLFAGDERRVVIELSTDARQGEVLPLDTEISWSDVEGQSNDLRLAALTVGATHDRDEAERSRDPQVYARCLSAVASLRNLEAAQAYADGDRARADAILGQNLDELRSAASAAPEAEAQQLQAQADSYADTQKRFKAAAPRSAAGRSAAKAAAESDNANLAREFAY
ncbi:MAG: VWA domain-containing protein [Deltaproteobacteria bacterium]|nr:VWA domain-containing protein [Deltaproteobacteria bacterium]MBW2535814.1 VWA domain-containing protein [Deltaproteobacteria bacterium]